MENKKEKKLKKELKEKKQEPITLKEVKEHLEELKSGTATQDNKYLNLNDYLLKGLDEKDIIKKENKEIRDTILEFFKNEENKKILLEKNIGGFSFLKTLDRISDKKYYSTILWKERKKKNYIYHPLQESL